MRASSLLLFAGAVASAQDPGAEFFESRIRPLLAAKCYSCHAEVRTSGLRADSRDALLKGGNRGAAVIPGDPAASLLMKAVRHQNGLNMPPGAKLAEAEIAALERWIASGAAWPESKALVSAASRPITAADRGFWSFRPLANPGGTIDSFVRARLEKRGLAPNPPAGRHTLLRRLSFDLTGLPPSRAELSAFLSDTRAGALERAVDRLLGSPRFGERWGRHWLDVARYGEEDYTGTAPKLYSNAWRYRDWVVKALNDDMPYDTFVKAQIAADLMPDNANLLGGLGLFGFGPWYYGISQPPQARSDERHDRVDMITRGFLGLTGACARCHDHKYEPIGMRDYYGLAGVFHSSKYAEYPLAPPDEVTRYKKAQDAVKAQEAKISKFLEDQRDQIASMFSYRIAAAMMGDAGVDKELAERFTKYLSKPEEEFAYLDGWRQAAERGAPAEERRALAEKFQALVIDTAEEKRKLDDASRSAKAAAAASAPKKRTILLPFGYDSELDFNPGADVPVKSLDTQRMLLWRRFFHGKDGLLRFDGAAVERLLEGAWKRHLEVLRAELKRLEKASPAPYGFWQGLAEHEQPADLPLAVRGDPFVDGAPVPRQFLDVLSTTPLQKGSGRLELAEAVVRAPVAARVAANRAWMHMTGSGIARTPSNLGRSGSPPSNPELLEYLAWRLVNRGWSIKSLIREIALSETYQASSSANAANEKADPSNESFWRANRRRLDAESLRDSILEVSGGLDPRTGGESAPLDDKFPRRALYARVSRFLQEERLALFDFPAASVSVEKRAVTNVPPQKLFFLNSPFLLSRAEALGNRMREMGIDAAYETLFARPPEAGERRLALDFTAAGGPGVWRRYAQVLLASNEFAFVD